MNKFNFIKPDKRNLQSYLFIGSFLIFLSILDVLLKSSFEINLTYFLPDTLNFFLPLILGTIGLYFIRIEYTGIKNLDLLNKHINTNNFNAVLTLLIIFVAIITIPPSLNWLIFDATITGDTKEACTGSGACWTFVKIWLLKKTRIVLKNFI